MPGSRLGLIRSLALFPLIAAVLLSCDPGPLPYDVEGEVSSLEELAAREAEPETLGGESLPGAPLPESPTQLVNCIPGTGFCGGGEVGEGPVLDPNTDDCGQPSSVTLTAAPLTLQFGQSATLQWSVSYPYVCNPPVIAVNGVPVTAQGSLVVTPLSTTPYVISVGGKFLAPPVAVQVILPAVVRIKGSTAEWRRLLVQALADALPGYDAVPQAQHPGRTVLLAHDVDMDLTSMQDIYISQGVTLTSELPPPAATSGSMASLVRGPVVATQGPVARNAFSLGPRLFTRSRPKPLFRIHCNGENIFGDRVRLIGFRIQGPHFDTEEGDANLERGVLISSCVGVEISNMEFSGWSGQAVYVEDRLERLSPASMVKIHDNFFHHNQHASGNGYGVDVSGGGYADIQRNLFDFNRHAIAASGAPGTGYRAERNLILKGGGLHDRWYNTWTHQVDAHGDAHCPDIPFHEDHTWNCGNAGEQFWINFNAFQYTNDLSIKIRGTPRVHAEIIGNVFAQDDVDDAVGTHWTPATAGTVSTRANVTLSGNRAGIDPFGKYGVCDLDRDGKDDLLLATGVTWWYSSGGRREWRHLRSATEQLHQVGLGDFDGDGRCDVFAVQNGAWVISSGGTSAFTPLPGTYAGIPFRELAFGDFNGDRRADIFRRAPDGQWSAISPGVYPWTVLGSSSFALSSLRFGDFDGNGITDVIAVQDGSWSVSWDARARWEPLRPGVTSSLASVLIADVDGIKGDDIVRYVVVSPIVGRWEVSSGGFRSWRTLTTVSYQDTDEMRLRKPAAQVKTIVGRFDVWNGSDVLALDESRIPRIFSEGHSNMAPHGLYAL